LYDASSLVEAIEVKLDRYVVPLSRSAKLTLCQQIQLVNEQSLVLSPGEVESLGGEEFWDTVLFVVCIVLQLGNAMNGTGLEA
jgi:hypothetical protein